MGWMETLTKEAIFTAVREAVRPEFETLENRLEKRIEMLENRLESEMKGVNGQIKGLEGEIVGIKSLHREINSNNMETNFFVPMIPESVK